MKEIVFKHYFEGKLEPESLTKALLKCVKYRRFISFKLRQKKFSKDFTLNKAMLAKLCEDCINERIDISTAETIAFTLLGSKHIKWTDNRINFLVFNWVASEINYPLTNKNLKKFKRLIESRKHICAKLN